MLQRGLGRLPPAAGTCTQSSLTAAGRALGPALSLLQRHVCPREGWAPCLLLTWRVISPAACDFTWHVTSPGV